jgi:hypothetical protein
VAGLDLSIGRDADPKMYKRIILQNWRNLKEYVGADIPHNASCVVVRVHKLRNHHLLQYERDYRHALIAGE